MLRPHNRNGYLTIKTLHSVHRKNCSCLVKVLRENVKFCYVPTSGDEEREANSQAACC